MTKRYWISGFSTKKEQKRFIRDEIRYIRSMEMAVYECRNGSYLFEFQGDFKSDHWFSGLAREHSELAVYTAEDSSLYQLSGDGNKKKVPKEMLLEPGFQIINTVYETF